MAKVETSPATGSGSPLGLPPTGLSTSECLDLDPVVLGADDRSLAVDPETDQGGRHVPVESQWVTDPYRVDKDFDPASRRPRAGLC